MSTLTQLFTSIANAIRAKKHTESLIYAEDFSNEIADMEDSSDATATANDIISPKTAYVNGEKITGNLPDPETLYSAVSQLPNAANVGKGVIQSIFDISTEANFNFQNPYITTTEGFTFKTIGGINELPYSNVSIVIVQLNSQDFYAILFESNSMFITPKGAGWPCSYGGRTNLINSTVKVYHYQNNDWVLDTSKSQTISNNVARKTGSPDWGLGGVFGTTIKFPGKEGYNQLTYAILGTSYEVFDYYSGSSFYNKAFNVADATPPDMSDLTLDEVLQRNLYNGLDVYYSDKTNWSKIASSSKDANVAASDILNGKIAYKNNAKITGTMPNNGALNYTPSSTAQTIPAGYTSGGTVAAMDITTSSDYTTCLGLSEQIIGGEPTPEYTELEYIQSTGTQYIDTGYKASNNTKIEIKYKTMDTWAYHAVFGARSNRYLYMLDADNTNYNTKEIGYYSTYNKPSLNFTTHEIETTVVLNKNVFTINNVNGTDTRTFSTGTFNININCYLFAFNDNGSVQRIGKTNIYYCKIYDNDVLVHDFIPVKDPNDVVCLYDKVSQDYFYNAGTGTFIAGGEV